MKSKGLLVLDNSGKYGFYLAQVILFVGLAVLVFFFFLVCIPVFVLLLAPSLFLPVLLVSLLLTAFPILMFLAAAYVLYVRRRTILTFDAGAGKLFVEQSLPFHKTNASFPLNQIESVRYTKIWTGTIFPETRLSLILKNGATLAYRNVVPNPDRAREVASFLDVEFKDTSSKLFGI